MSTNWKETLKRSALEALAAIGSDTLDDARQLLTELEKAGHSVTLEQGDALSVSPPVTPDFAGRIRQLKPDLIAVLRDAPTSLGWRVEDVAVHCSLSSNAISDFVLAPPIEGVVHTEIPKAVANALLAGADAAWKARIKKMGGLVAYSLSQFAAAKSKLESAMQSKVA